MEKESTEKTSENVVERRKFLKISLLGAAAATITAMTGWAAPAAKAVKKRYGMVIDLRRCYGCHACSVSCKSEHNIRLGVFRSYVNQVEVAHGQSIRRSFVPRLCNHCDRPPCVKVCPVEATYKREDGVVMIRKERCIGCRYCMAACPYGARSFKWTRGEEQSMDWPSNRYGVVDKCDLCVHRIDSGVMPSCVNTCPAKARIFGDMHDPNSEVAKIVSTAPVATIAPELGTEPHVFYVNLDHGAAWASFKTGAKLDPIRTKASV